MVAYHSSALFQFVFAHVTDAAQTSRSAAFCITHISSTIQQEAGVNTDLFVPPRDVAYFGIATYAYRTGFTGMVSPDTAMTVRVSGPCADGLIPGEVGCSLVAGNTTANMLRTSADISAFRISNAAVPAPDGAPDTTCKIWRNEAEFSVLLSPPTPGRYWLDFNPSINGSSIHFAPVITVPGKLGLPGWNAVQDVGTGYQSLLDGGDTSSAPDVPQDFPFGMLGTDAQRPIGQGCAPSNILFQDGFETIFTSTHVR